MGSIVLFYSFLCTPLSRFLAFELKGVESLSQLLKYSWTIVIETWLFRIPSCVHLKTISLGSVLQSFTNGHFKLLLFLIPLSV